MVKKTIIILVLFLLLIAGAVWEEIYLIDSLKELEVKTNSIESYLTNDINFEGALFETEQLESYWTEREKVLCLIINYKEIKDIVSQIKKLKQVLVLEKEEDCIVELANLKFLAESCNNIIGFNIQNVL